MRIPSLLVLFVCGAFAADAPPPATVSKTIPADNGFTYDFKERCPGDVLTVNVSPDSGHVMKDGKVTGGAPVWVGQGNFVATGTMPDDDAGQHDGTFTGLYRPTGSGSGSGQSDWLVWTGAAKAEAIEIIHETVLTAANNADSRRTTVGICEEVIFSVKPAKNLTTWSTTAGAVAPAQGAMTRWTAPDQPGACIITATIEGNSCSVEMTVVQPSGVSAVKELGSGDIQVNPAQVGAGMLLRLTFEPTTVSFGNVEAKEGAVPADNLQGYFNVPGNEPVGHTSAEDAETWAWVGEDNAAITDAAVYFLALGANPQQNGSFNWNIPLSFRCMNSDGNGTELGTFTQQHSLTAPKTFTVAKFGFTETRTAQ